jgi:hypothetical protein
MGVVKDKMLQSDLRPTVIADCVQLIEDEVNSKKGVSGMLIKGGFKAFKKFRPSMVTEAVDHLLDKFAEILDRVYTDYQKEGPDKSVPFDKWATNRDTWVANEMLSITDDIVGKSNKNMVKKIYGGMRKVAEKNTAQAVPGVARLIIKHVG